MRTLVLEYITVGLDVDSSVKDGSLYFRKILGESLVLVSNLEGKLTSVTEDKDGHLVLPSRESIGVKLVQSSKNENSSLSHTTLCLADDIHTKDGLGNTFVLNFRRMLETAVDYGTEALGLEDKVLETRSVDSNVVTPG